MFAENCVMGPIEYSLLGIPVLTDECNGILDDIDEISRDLIAMANDATEHTSQDWEGAVEACTDIRIVNPNAINVFVHPDNWSYL